MPKEKAPPQAPPAGKKTAVTRASATANSLPTVTKSADNKEPKKEAGEIVINSRASKESAAPVKKSGGRKTATAEKTSVPPKDEIAPPAPEIIIKTSTPPHRQRPTGTTATRRASGSPARRSPSSPTINGRAPRSRPRPAGPFHETDRLPGISDDLRHEISGIVLIVVGLIFFLAMFSQEGVVGQVGRFARQMLGVGAFIVPPLIMLIGGTLIWEGLTNRERFKQSRVVGAIFMIIAFTALTHLLAGNPKRLADEGGGGGYFAYYINEFLRGLITPFGVGILWLALLVIGLMLALNMSLQDMGGKIRNAYRWVRGDPPLVAGEPLEADDFDEFDDDYGYDEFDGRRRGPRSVRDGRRGSPEDDDFLDELLLNGATRSKQRRATLVPEVPEPQYTHSITLNEEDDDKVIPPATPPTLAPEPPSTALSIPNGNGREKSPRPLQQNWKRDETSAVSSELPHREWQIPSVNVLASFSDVEVNPQELRKKARQIENCLSSFGVEAFVREVNTGPTVTQFALEPGIGVKVARITALTNDLALALAAPAIRIEAPVPGQSRVGIEVPNAKVATVGLREMMEAEEFTKRAGHLKFALGRDVSGQPIVPDLAKMPHLLIAGSTGSGKSVCLNSIVAAYLLQYRPTELQFIMIDPKMVELSTYNGIPHLRFPVVTQIEADPDKERNRNDRTPTVMSVLKWSIREMERRYKLLSLYGHRNIESFNKAAGVGNELEKLSYTVLIVDELADLMMVAPEEAESAICRLAQKARAVGIHLILATQRPSVDVVTGLIKANFPSRITFAVTSQIDSRVILDMAGAEKLLGRGDMLYMASDAAKPMRVQGVYVSDEEIDMLVKHWRQQHDFLTGDKKDFVQPTLWPQELQDIEAERDGGDTDELFEQALEIVREARTASTSLLQRRLRVGYNRAARLIEELAQAGVIGQAEGSRPRPVLLAEEDLGEPQSLTAAASAFEPMPPVIPSVQPEPIMPPVPLPVEPIRSVATGPAARSVVSFPPPPDPAAPIRPRQHRPPEEADPLARPYQRPVSADYDPDPPI